MFSSPQAPRDQLLWELLTSHLRETAVRVESLALKKFLSPGDSVALGKERTMHWLSFSVNPQAKLHEHSLQSNFSFDE